MEKKGWHNVGSLWKDERGFLKGKVFGKYVCVFVNRGKQRKGQPDYVVWHNDKKVVGYLERQKVKEVEREVEVDEEVPF